MNEPMPFTQRQMEYLQRSLFSWLNVAEGGKRGGKNVLQVMAFCIALEEHPSRLHLIAGVSVATARLNIIDCDGYGLMNYFDGACRTGTYQNRDCLYVKTERGDEKIILVSGGGKNGDEKLIQGNTYGMAYVTEANLCAPAFIKEIFDRTISSPNRKIFHDLNPKAESHWYYSDILAQHERKQQENPSYGYNYGHFTLTDNMSISDEQMRRVIGTYDKNTVWYQRDILGLRKQAEGLIYQTFADDPESFLVDAGEYLKEKRLARVLTGVDWGHNKSANTQVAFVVTQGIEELIALDEFYTTEKLDPEQLYSKHLEFMRGVERRYGRMVTYCDNAEMMLVRGLKNSAAKAGIAAGVLECVKRPITDRIVLFNSLFAQGRIKIDRNRCPKLIDAFKSAVWDSKAVGKDVRLDDGTSNIDSLDAAEYAVCGIMKELEIAGRVRNGG